MLQEDQAERVQKKLIQNLLPRRRPQSRNGCHQKRTKGEYREMEMERGKRGSDESSCPVLGSGARPTADNNAAAQVLRRKEQSISEHRTGWVPSMFCFHLHVTITETKLTDLRADLGGNRQGPTCPGYRIYSHGEPAHFSFRRLPKCWPALSVIPKTILSIRNSASVFSHVRSTPCRTNHLG